MLSYKSYNYRILKRKSARHLSVQKTAIHFYYGSPTKGNQLWTPLIYLVIQILCSFKITVENKVDPNPFVCDKKKSEVSIFAFRRSILRDSFKVFSIDPKHFYNSATHTHNIQ